MNLMAFENALRRILSLFLPLVGWRLPVALLRGLERASGRPATLLVAGQENMTSYVSQRFFACPPAVESLGKIPLWRLTGVLDHWQNIADLTAVCVDRHTARLFSAGDWLVSPAWIGSKLRVPVDIRHLTQQNSSLARDWRKVQSQKFEGSFSRDGADFDLFYDHFHLPYIRQRHHQLAILNPRWGLRRRFRRGGIQWMWRDGKRLAGMIIAKAGATLQWVVLGLAEGDPGIMRSSVIAALYFETVRFAQQHGFQEIDTGGARPSLHDGLFQYKRKWGVTLCEKKTVNFEMLLRWNRLAGPEAGFLAHTSIIHRDRGGFSALWVYPGHLPFTAEQLEREIHFLQTPGLRRLRILVPAEPPAGFECPPGVRLIQLSSVADAGPEFLCSQD